MSACTRPEESDFSFKLACFPKRRVAQPLHGRRAKSNTVPSKGEGRDRIEIGSKSEHTPRGPIGCGRRRAAASRARRNCAARAPIRAPIRARRTGATRRARWSGHTPPAPPVAPRSRLVERRRECHHGEGGSGRTGRRPARTPTLPRLRSGRAARGRATPPSRLGLAPTGQCPHQSRSAPFQTSCSAHPSVPECSSVRFQYSRTVV